MPLRGSVTPARKEIPKLEGQGDSRGTGWDLQLLQDVVDMLLNRPRAEAELIGDLDIAETSRQFSEDLTLTVGE